MEHTDERELTRWAATLEYRQAERDYSEAYAYMASRPYHDYMAEYATWSAGGYADSAKRAIDTRVVS